MAQSVRQISRPTNDPTRNQLILIVFMIVVAVIVIGSVLAFSAGALTGPQKWLFFSALLVLPFFSILFLTWLIMRHSKKLIVSSNDENLEWETTTPELQKRNLNHEVNELARILDIAPEQLTDLRSAYIVAEDLALRKIQNETGIPMMRKVLIGSSDFDAVWIDKDLITCVEVTFVVTPSIDQRKIDRILRKASTAKSTLARTRKGSRLRLLMTVVTQLEGSAESELRSNVKAYFKTTPVDVDIRFLDFLDLQKVYAEE